MDEDQRVQALALGTLMVNNKELKRDMMDNAYNRYAFNDGDLPSWFLDDEDKHNKPQLPITKDMVAEIKRKTLEINARPIKKVAEAKARKKMRTDKKTEQIKAKAQSIADSADLTPAEKNKQIERLYKKEKKKPRAKEKAYVVTKKSQKGKPQLAGLKQKGKRLKVVDPRMKKDHLKNKANTKGKTKSNKPSNRKEGSKERKHRKSLHPQSATPDRGTKRKR